ncbi:MAG: LytTR family DNA-binding domain-containing protein [Bacillota bacterium]
MQIEIRIDTEQKTPKIIILADKITDEVTAIIKRLSEEAPQVIAGFRGDTLKILEPLQMVRIYAAAGKIYAATEQGEYTLRLRLYELEERLDQNSFVRISNSEIVNLRKVKGFDLSLAGTICVTLSDGTTTYVSRRYVAKIKHVLGL